MGDKLWSYAGALHMMSRLGLAIIALVISSD